MFAARLYNYGKPLVLEETSKPILKQKDQILVKIGACGLGHGNLHFINGDWKDSISVKLPIIPGHEIAGWVDEIGDSVPKGLFAKGDMVAVFGGWGCGICLSCKNGDEQLCEFGKWPGIMLDGGFAEYIAVPYRFLLKIEQTKSIIAEEEKYNSVTSIQTSNEFSESVYIKDKFSIECAALLTNTGLTSYRAIKQIKNYLGPGKSIGIIGIGGLGYYAVQYAKILGQSADVIAFDTNNERLQLAIEAAADFTINNAIDFSKIKDQVSAITKGKGIDVIIDCVGTENTISISSKLLGKSGSIVIVGMFGNKIKIPSSPLILNEYKIRGSLWGNYNELREVIKLAKIGKLRYRINKFSLHNINEAINQFQN